MRDDAQLIILCSDLWFLAPPDGTQLAHGSASARFIRISDGTVLQLPSGAVEEAHAGN
jgi:hypothetical protein